MTEDVLPQSPSNDPIQAAAEWHVLMQSGESTDEEQQAFQQWLKNPTHAEAYQRFEGLWQRLDVAQSAPAHQTVQQVLAQPQTESGSGSMFRYTLPTILLCSLGLYLVSQSDTGELLLADHHNLSQYSETITLPDQSQIVLGPYSAVDLAYTHQHRKIHLLSGEISLNVAKEHVNEDQQRPLSVLTQHGSAQALGTQFRVREYAQYSQVSVIESRVKVCAHQNPTCRSLSAGEQVRLSYNAVEPVQAINSGFIIDPFSQSLIVEEQPVLKVLETLQRHHMGYLRIDPTGLEQLKVSGVFPLDDSARALDVLASSLPIKVKRYTPLLTLIKRQR